MDCSVEFVLKCIGIVTSLYIGLKIASRIIHVCRVYLFATYPDFSKYGKWSVVTGSTDGIGKGIALKLASFGQNIVLISRNKQKLEKVAREIESTHNVQTKILQIDFSHDEDIYDKIEEFLKGMDIGTLVNNVGFGYLPYNFLDTPNLSSLLRDITRVNMFALYKMHQIVLPGMVQRRRGLIINVSSISSIVPFKHLAIYGATKAFDNYFSQAIRYEYADKGITIHSVMPGFVSTNLIGNPETSILYPSVESFVNASLATVDKEGACHGYLPHSLQAWVFKLLPLQWSQDLLLWFIDRAEKKMAERNKQK